MRKSGNTYINKGKKFSLRYETNSPLQIQFTGRVFGTFHGGSRDRRGVHSCSIRSGANLCLPSDFGRSRFESDGAASVRR